MRLFFIINPTAGGGRGQRVWAAVSRELARRQATADYGLTDGPAAATRLAAQARQEGYDAVVGVGGDGTIQEIVNGLVDGNGGCPSALGVIPGGTGNDFSKMLGVPRDPSRALDVVLGGQVRRFDLGRANGRYFINLAGVGFDAEVAGFLNQRPKRLPGALTYVYGILVTLFRYRPALMTVDLGREVIRGKYLLVSVANGPSHAGGAKMCPEARPDDGSLDICVGGNLGRLETIFVLPQVFTGRHTRHPKIKIYKAIERVRIDAEAPLFLQADGEIFGRVPADLEIVPGALRVIGAAATGSPAGS